MRIACALILMAACGAPAAPDAPEDSADGGGQPAASAAPGSEADAARVPDAAAPADSAADPVVPDAATDVADPDAAPDAAPPTEDATAPCSDCMDAGTTPPPTDAGAAPTRLFCCFSSTGPATAFCDYSAGSYTDTIAANACKMEPDPGDAGVLVNPNP